MELSNGLRTTSIKIYNTLGSLVLDKKVNANAKSITINHNLKAGVYFVNTGNKSIRLIAK
ncbi:T9SS type A sorting domain-containing protein [Mariniflexile litorale]|uniref:T9SS type A sorting domain-containing protein n=1 Tax=Mariniflexile litorale TaxID=3045158 RepID=UPI0034DB5194